MEAFKMKYPSLYPERVTTQGEKMNQLQQVLEDRDKLIDEQNVTLELSRQIIEQQEELIELLKKQISVLRWKAENGL